MIATCSKLHKRNWLLFSGRIFILSFWTGILSWVFGFGYFWILVFHELYYFFCCCCFLSLFLIRSQRRHSKCNSFNHFVIYCCCRIFFYSSTFHPHRVKENSTLEIGPITHPHNCIKKVCSLQVAVMV